MTYHILNNDDFKILVNKKFVTVNKHYYLYNNTIIVDKIFKKYKIKPSISALILKKGLANTYGGKSISLYNIDSLAQIDNFCFYIYDTREFWEEELKENKFEEIEL